MRPSLHVPRTQPRARWSGPTPGGLPRQARRCVVPLVLATLACTVAVADEGAVEYRTVSWTTAEGLPQNSINDLALLPNGELWIATFGGLARFDGVGFRVLDIASDQRLPDNRILALVPVGRDGFYFLTLRGHLGRVTGGRAETLVPPATGDFEALGLLVDRRGTAWTRSVDGRLFRAVNGQWRAVAGGGGLTSGLHGVAETDDGQVWASLGERLVRVDGDAVVDRVRVPVPAHNLVPRQGGGLWVATERGLYTLRDGRLTAVPATPALGGHVSAVAQEHPDALWVSTGGVVSRYVRGRDGAWTGLRVPLSFPPDHYVRLLHVDGAGGAWVGTTGLGLHHVAPLPLRRLGASRHDVAVTALATDGRGGTYIAEWCGAVRYVSPAWEERTIDRQALPARHASGQWPCSVALATAGAGRVWLRVEDDVMLLDLEGRRVRRVGKARSVTPGPIVPEPRGGLYVVSRDGTVERLTATGAHQRHWVLPAPLVSAALAGDGRLWLGGNGRLFRLTGDSVEELPGALPHADIRDVLVEQDGTAWLATYGGGLVRWRAGRVATITAANGLPDNSISRVVRDGRDRLWMATNRGLALADRRALEEVADRGRRRASIVVLGPDRGVPEATFGLPAGFIDSRGLAWFGSISGAVAIDTARFPVNQTAPRARIESVLIDDRTIPPGPRIVIPPHARRIRFEFSSLGLGVPDRVSFRFRVEGLDADWVDTGLQRTVDWTPPSPGEHHLLVQARNEDGVWGQDPIMLVIEVEPAWWQTTSVRAATVLAAALVVVGGWRWRTHQIETRHADRVRVLKEQADAERRITTLRAQLDHVSRVALAGELAASLAHEVSQPLAAMVNNAEAARQQLPYYLAHVDELSTLLEDLVRDGLRASDVVHGLRSFLRPRAAETGCIDLNDVVREMLPLVQREVRDHRVALDLELADDLPPVDGVRVQLGQIVLNLAWNACEALGRVEGPRELHISTHRLPGVVQLRVRDTGPGIAPGVLARVFDPFVTTKPDGLGMGLAISRAIAEAHGGKLTVTPGTPGAEFVLTVPAATTRNPS